MSSFFEEYKSLDNLCRDILESERGVSEYLERMENNERGRMLVVDWDRDYKRLKSLRYLRNRIAHEDGANEKDLCTDKDIAFMSDFIQRIMDETDPLTVLLNYDSAENEGQKVPVTAPKSAEKGKKVPLTDTKNQDNEDKFPDYPEISAKGSDPQKQKSKRVRTAQKPVGDEGSYTLPSFSRPDPITAVSAILLLIGVVWALIVSLS